MKGPVLVEDFVDDVTVAGDVENRRSASLIARERKPSVSVGRLLEAMNIEREAYCLVTAATRYAAYFEQ